MNEQDLLAEARTLSRWERHKFLVLVGATIVVSLCLVSVAMGIYSTSGAAQLDLSRPGYQSVRQQVSRTDEFDGFPATGTIDADALAKFRELYAKQSDQANAVDGFAGDVMSDKALSIDEAPPLAQ